MYSIKEYINEVIYRQSYSYTELDKFCDLLFPVMSVDINLELKSYKDSAIFPLFRDLESNLVVNARNSLIHECFYLKSTLCNINFPGNCPNKINNNTVCVLKSIIEKTIDLAPLTFYENSQHYIDLMTKNCQRIMSVCHNYLNNSPDYPLYLNNSPDYPLYLNNSPDYPLYLNNSPDYPLYLNNSPDCYHYYKLKDLYRRILIRLNYLRRLLLINKGV